MNKVKKTMAFVLMFGLYATVSTMEYNDAVTMEQTR
jgi:hypothetical protein